MVKYCLQKLKTEETDKDNNYGHDSGQFCACQQRWWSLKKGNSKKVCIYYQVTTNLNCFFEVSTYVLHSFTPYLKVQFKTIGSILASERLESMPF